MTDRPRIIKFHENYKTYYWDKAASEVRDANNEKIDNGKYYNLQQARERVRRL